MLAILDKLEPKKVSAAFKKLVAVAVRFQIVGGSGGGTLERIYSDAARGVAEGKLTSINDILKGFTTLPTDSAFIAAFTVASISKQGLARFYLRMLETEAPGVSRELMPNTDTGQVNLEHVLPLTLSDKWNTDWSVDDAKAYQRRLGNMAIMAAKANSSLGNDEFSKKKPVLAKSQFAFTKLIGDYAKWDRNAIENRQSQMAQVAAKVWSVR